MERDSLQGNILIVDDTQAAIDLLGAALKTEGYGIIEATDGDSAIALAKKALPDLILLDVLMPGMDGFETCRRLKAQETTRDIPVVFMTGIGTTDSKLAAFEAGGVDYVSKPVEIRVVLARVRTHLALRQMHRKLETRNIRLGQEIAQRMEVESALRESEARYRLLVETLPGIVYKGYADWTVEFTNTEVETITGYDRDEFNSRRKKWSDIIVQEDLEAAQDSLLLSLRTSKPFLREYRISTRDGQILWIRDRGHVVCNAEGRIDYVIGVLFDVTERKRMEKALIHREKISTLGAIAAEVAHEIRNPLVSIGGFARRLKQKSPNLPECDIILQECRRLEKILTRIRDYLKPVEIHTRECSINAIIEDTVKLLSPEMELRKVVCHLDLASDLPLVQSDPDILTQIFVNLILNAAAAMNQGGVIEIKTLEGNRDLLTQFRNTAPDRPVQEPDLLFMPFSEGGESIGLPLCYRKLEDMGGLLSCTQEKGFMVFTVSLPKPADQASRSRR